MLKKTFLLANIALLLVSCQSARHPLSEDEAARLLASGELATAQATYEKLAEKSENFEHKAALWFRAAEIAGAEQKFERALIDYQKALHLVPFSQLAEEASARRAEIYSELNNPEAMVTEYSQLLKHYSKSASRYTYKLRLAEGHLVLGRFSDALRELESIYQDPNLPKEMKETVFFNAAELYFLDGKFQQAMNSYTAFLQTFPNSSLAGEAHLKLASVLERMGQLSLAYQAAKPAETLYPNKAIVEMRLQNLTKNMTPPTQAKKAK